MKEFIKVFKSGLWMPQFNNDDIVSCILRTVIDVVSRRTSEGYAVVIIGRIIKQMEEKHVFLKHIEIKNTQYSEAVDALDIKPDINYVNQEMIGGVIKEFIETLTTAMGKNAGFFFIKEVKEDIPYIYEETVRELGIDLDLMQLDYITKKKKEFRLHIENSDAVKYVLNVLFNMLDRDFGRNFAVSTLSELVERLSTTYDVLKYVKINDIRYIQGVETVYVKSDVDVVEPSRVGGVIQKIIQEVNNSLDEKGGPLFIERLRESLTEDYIFKLGEMGVNLHVIHLRQELIVKHVLRALIDVLSEVSSQGYAVLNIDSVLREVDEKFGYLKYVKIDSTRYSEGIDAVSVPTDIDAVSPSELGRALQKLIEKVALSLGEEAGEDFIDRFKERLGKAYLLRIEKMGVNLHMIQLRRNLL